MKKEFKASFSYKTKIITFLFNIIALVVIYILLYKEDWLKHSNQPPNTIKYIVIVIILISIACTFGFHVIKYSISETNIIIHRPFYNKIIATNQIILAQQIYFPDLSITFRLFGSGGIWGYIGIFYSSKIGNINLFSTKLGNNILITTKSNKRILLSPNNPEQFLQTIQKTINNETP